MTENVKITALVALAVVLSLAILWGMGYTKAQNDQEYYKIIGEQMSESGFEEWMMPKMSKGHSGG